MRLLDRTEGGVERHLVTRLDNHRARKTGSQNGGVEGWRNGSGHFATWTENRTEMATDQSHVRDFGEEKVVLVGDLLGTTFLSTEVFDVLR